MPWPSGWGVLAAPGQGDVRRKLADSGGRGRHAFVIFPNLPLRDISTPEPPFVHAGVGLSLHEGGGSRRESPTGGERLCSRRSAS
jgi:hypothetical protein